MNNTLLTTIGGVIILCFIIVAILIRFKTNKASYNKNEVKEFLNGLSNVFYDKVVDIINNIDFSVYGSLEEMETAIISEMYDTIWEFVESKLKELSKTDVVTAIILKTLDKKVVEDFLEEWMNDNEIINKLEARWNDNFKSNVEETVENDKKLQEEFSGSDYNESFSEEDLAPAAERVEISNEEMASLVPPSDDEEEYNPDDESMEVLDDDTYVDDSGRKRSKTTGRYV